MPNEIVRFFKDIFFSAAMEKNTERRLYYYSTLTSFLALIFFVIPAKIFLMPARSYWTVILFGVAAFASLWFHLNARKNRMYPMAFLTILGLVFFSVGILNGGRDGPLPFMFYYDYVLMFAIVKENWKRIVMIAYHFVLASLLQISDILFPGIFLSYTNELTRSIDTSLVYIGGFLVLGILQQQILRTQILLEKEYRISVKKLEKEKTFDQLTGCINKDSVYKILLDLLQYLKKSSTDFTISAIMGDIDFFKKVNDTYGHLIGDEILKSVGMILRSSFRKSDYVGRFGGEEFLILLPRTCSKEAGELADQVRKNISGKNYSKEELSITMSFGVTEIQNDDDMTSFIERCDSLLYVSKKNGRNRITVG